MKLTSKLIAGMFLFLGLVLRGEDFSSLVNNRLENFFRAAQQTNRPLTVLSFGDSMANSYMSVAWSLMTNLTSKYGTAGFTLNNYQNNTMYNFTNGVQVLGPSNFWFSTHFRVPPDAAVWWNTQNPPAGVKSDLAGIYWVAQPDGGAMKLLVSTNLGEWTLKAVLDGYSAEAVGRFTNISLSLNNYRVRIESQNGTNYVIGPQLLNSQTNGINVTFIDYPGIHLGQITNVPVAVRRPVLNALAPDVLIWHMKEDGSQTTYLRLLENEEWFQAAAPQMDVIYIGTPYASIDTNSTGTTDQNRTVRLIASQHNRAYVDLMTPGVDYQWQLTNGFMSDATHINHIGSQYFADIFWKEAGFFALRANRNIRLQNQGSSVNLQWTAAANISYKIEESSDLVDWTTLQTTNGTGVMNYNTPSASSRYFRLRLEPK